MELPKRRNFRRLGASYSTRKAKNVILTPSSQLAQCTVKTAATAEGEGGMAEPGGGSSGHQGPSG